MGAQNNRFIEMVVLVTQNMFGLRNKNTVKPVLSGHSKIDKTKVLMTNGSFNEG